VVRKRKEHKEMVENARKKERQEGVVKRENR